MLQAILGESLWVFFGLTVVLVGGCAFLMGQAIAGTWRPYWQILPYSLILAAANRFLAFALFKEQLLGVVPYLVSIAVVWGFATFGYRLTKVDQMVHQYPWLYERSGLLGWREKQGTP
jgi:branched-chain amino acid transport system ATP-binding protein